MKSHRERNRKLLSALTAVAVASSLLLGSPANAASPGRGAGGGGGIGGLLNAVARGASATLNNLLAAPLGLLGVSAAPQSGSRTVDGALGGVVTVGRFTVIVPPGAFLGEGQVTITVPAGDKLECELEITPADRNDFAIPVTLSVDASGANTEAPYTLKLGWWDPAQSKWVPVSGSNEDNLTLRVSAPLHHFSKYGCFDSKAGW